MSQLLRRYRPLILNLARKWSRFGIDDALQEAYVAALEAVHCFDVEGDYYFGAFLRYRIQSHLRTWGRRQIRWTTRHTVASAQRDEEEGVAVEEWADDHAFRYPIPWEWKEWLVPLSPRERLVIIRHVIEGYTLKEIADMEAVSRHTVQTWKKRAMKKLRHRKSRYRSYF